MCDFFLFGGGVVASAETFAAVTDSFLADFFVGNAAFALDAASVSDGGIPLVRISFGGSIRASSAVFAGIVERSPLDFFFAGDFFVV